METDLKSFYKENRQCLVVLPIFKDKKPANSQARLEEGAGLAKAIDLEVVEALIVQLQEAKPATLIGQGKVEELCTIIKAKEIPLVIIDSKLGPTQQRNLEKVWGCKVIDRTALILEIFGARANTSEGKLQVELATLEYQKTRLVRSWTHLERQRGGFGFLGGPGEKQIESDRRAIADEITRIKLELEKVKRTRSLHRKARKTVPYPIVALVGYTNAGKSTLFNKLTGADVYAEDKLFATLDPTMRVVNLPLKRKIILSDTVGFISELPTELIAAFRATLEEVTEADIIVHVRDISSEETEEQKKDVLQILVNLGLEDQLKNRTIEVLNKIDLLPNEEKIGIKEKALYSINIIPISAISGENCDKLIELVDKILSSDEKEIEIKLPISDGKNIAWVYENTHVIERKSDDEFITLKISIRKEKLGKLYNLMEKNI